jgi:hypothetical protein
VHSTSTTIFRPLPFHREEREEEKMRTNASIAAAVLLLLGVRADNTESSEAGLEGA